MSGDRDADASWGSEAQGAMARQRGQAQGVLFDLPQGKVGNAGSGQAPAPTEVREAGVRRCECGQGFVTPDGKGKARCGFCGRIVGARAA